MAEVLAVVASGAGLASLALQLVDGVDRLRKRCENLKRLRKDTESVIEDLEMISLELRDFDINHLDILELQTGPILQGRYRARRA